MALEPRSANQIDPDVLDAFAIDGDVPARRASGGWINDTFIVGTPPFAVVQRISATYFDDTEGVMENLVRIVGHLEWKARFGDGGPATTRPATTRWFPKLLPTAGGKHYLFDDAGSIWRALDYIPGHAPTDRPSLALLADAAQMYGRFLGAVSDLGGPPLREVVGWYRDLDAVSQRFTAAHDDAGQTKRSAAAEQLGLVEPILAAVTTHIATLDPQAWQQRPVHNDTKLDNVLVKPESSEITAVIDLDVAMQGAAAHDFGDLLRSSCHQLRADDGRPFSPETFEALAEGFVRGAGATLTAAEVTALPIAGARICLELGLRYLTDYLADIPVLWHGDPEQGLAKGHANLTLAVQILAELSALEAVAARLGAASGD